MGTRSLYYIAYTLDCGSFLWCLSLFVLMEMCMSYVLLAEALLRVDVLAATKRLPLILMKQKAAIFLLKKES